jgi:DNA-binding MarR family transcriptional regulator
MPIIRREKQGGNFVVSDKGYVEDERLSWQAKGIMIYALSKPNNWNLFIKDLINQATNGEHAVGQALKELEKFGYLYRRRNRGASGKYNNYETFVYESPKLNPFFSKETT